MEIIWIALVVGLLLGFVLERGFYCAYSGISNFILTRDYRLVKATIWAFLTTMIGFHALHSLGIQSLDPKTFFWAGSIIGAIVFGIGVVWAGGCIVGTPLRAGMGQIGYWITLLGMGIGGWLSIFGPLKSYVKTLQKPTEILIGGKNATLDALLGVNHWILVIIVGAFLIWLLIKLKGGEMAEEKSEERIFLGNKIFKKLWSPAALGIGLGIVEIIAFVSGKSPAGLGGFIAGYGTYINFLFTGKLPFNWPVLEVTGIIIGVFITALLAGEFRIIWPPLKRIPRLFFGGLFIGMGAVTAVGGCNVAHLISHVPQFSIGSIVSMIFIISVSYLMIYFEFIRRKGSA